MNHELGDDWSSRVHVGPHHVVKAFRFTADADREASWYRALPWACPALLAQDGPYLAIEKCVPLIYLRPQPEHAHQLRALLERVHAAGAEHRDVSVINVVWHPERGPLLIDWESARPAAGRLSWDLYGARAAGAAGQVLAHQRPDGIWWGGPEEDYAPANWWEVGPWSR